MLISGSSDTLGRGEIWWGARQQASKRRTNRRRGELERLPMSWWFTTSVLSLFLCLTAGPAIWSWRQRAVLLASERRRLAAEVESDRLRLRIQSLRKHEIRVEELEAELTELRACPAQLRRRDAELADVRAEVERLGTSVVSLTVEAARTGPLGVELARARRELQRVGSLNGRPEGALVSPTTEEPSLAVLRGLRSEPYRAPDDDGSPCDGQTVLDLHLAAAENQEAGTPSTVRS